MVNHQLRVDRCWCSPVVSLPHASPCLSAVAGGSGTPFSLLRVSQPSACPEHVSRIQWANSAWLRWSKEGPLSLGSRGDLGYQTGTRENASKPSLLILFSYSIHGTLIFQNSWAGFYVGQCFFFSFVKVPKGFKRLWIYSKYETWAIADLIVKRKIL